MIVTHFENIQYHPRGSKPTVEIHETLFFLSISSVCILDMTLHPVNVAVGK